MRRLPESVVAMLQGKAEHSADWAELAEAGREWYRDGKAGLPYELDPPPEGLFPAVVVEAADNFLRRCWEQGRREELGVSRLDTEAQL